METTLLCEDGTVSCIPSDLNMLSVRKTAARKLPVTCVRKPLDSCLAESLAWLLFTSLITHKRKQNKSSKSWTLRQCPQVASRGKCVIFTSTLEAWMLTARLQRKQWDTTTRSFEMRAIDQTLPVMVCRILNEEKRVSKHAVRLVLQVPICFSLSAGCGCGSCPQPLVLKVGCAAHLTDLTKQLRDISVFIAATRNIL